VLRQANVTEAHRVMIFGQDPTDEDCDSRTLGVLVTIRALDADVYVVAECQQEENRKLLWNAKVNEVVGAGSLRAELMVQGLQDPGINEVLGELLTNTKGHQFYIEELKAFAGSYGDLAKKIAEQGRYVLLGLVHGGERTFLPPDDTKLEPGQRVILVGEKRPTGL
jgi:voltage-gated potassium channel